MTCLLGIDLGSRRIGVALGTEDGHVRPLRTLARRDVAGDAVSLRRLAAEHRVTGLVVGLPLSLDGSEGPQADVTRAWAEAMARLTGLPLTYQDERRTSQDAERRMGAPARGRSGGAPSPAALRAYRGRVDREAACAILQAALDARHELTT